MVEEHILLTGNRRSRVFRKRLPSENTEASEAPHHSTEVNSVKLRPRLIRSHLKLLCRDSATVSSLAPHWEKKKNTEVLSVNIVIPKPDHLGVPTSTFIILSVTDVSEYIYRLYLPACKSSELVSAADTSV